MCGLRPVLLQEQLRLQCRKTMSPLLLRPRVLGSRVLFFMDGVDKTFILWQDVMSACRKTNAGQSEVVLDCI